MSAATAAHRASAVILMEPDCAAQAAKALRTMDDVTIKVRENGPYVVKGKVNLTDADGNPYTVETNFVLCRCGRSQTKPFCDGSHREGGFDAAERAPGT